MDKASAHPRIDAAEVSYVEVAEDGRRLCLRVRDAAGKAASVSLPVESLNAVLAAIPRSAGDLVAGGANKVYDLDSWSLAEAEQGLVLTLRLPDGAAISFAVKPWQIAAMASLAGPRVQPAPARLN